MNNMIFEKNDDEEEKKGEEFQMLDPGQDPRVSLSSQAFFD